MAHQAFSQLFAACVLFLDQARGRQAQKPHQRQRQRHQHHRLREFIAVDKPQKHQHRQKKARKTCDPQARHLRDEQQAVDVDPHEVFQIGLRLAPMTLGAQHHIKGHTKAVVAGG